MSSSCVAAPEDFVGNNAIYGTVLKDGQPLEGAYVRLTGSQDEFVAEVRTAGDGAFKFWAVPGDWRVSCLAPNAERLEQSVSLATRASAEVRFQLGAQAAAV
ncbi:MAG TPA: DUF1416 domain-containing protein [Candidatus Dormibacteraeota bacterium]|nr:DUF1416 domain-containing protein [Candidatus Dormibacteraeota bacterium]